MQFNDASNDVIKITTLTHEDKMSLMFETKKVACFHFLSGYSKEKCVMYKKNLCTPFLTPNHFRLLPYNWQLMCG